MTAEEAAEVERISELIRQADEEEDAAIARAIIASRTEGLVSEDVVMDILPLNVDRRTWHR